MQTVAASLEIHPFMLSKWRTDAREGRLTGELRHAADAAARRSPDSSNSSASMRSSKRSTTS